MTWTTERRQRQSQLIQTWKPWERSTGPKTIEGKEVAARNSWKGGHRTKLRAIIQMVNMEIRQARDMVESFQC